MATVIKSGSDTRHVRHVAFNLEDLKQQAAKYLDQVRVQAAQIVLDAQQQAEMIKRRAEEEGRQAALRGAEKVLDDKIGQRMQTLLPALQKVVAGIADAKQEWLSHWERSAVQLAAAMAGKVTRTHAPNLPDVTLKLVREALEMSAGTSQVRIHLHPHDAETLKGQVARLAAEFRRVGPAEIVADEAVTTGGCRIETQHGVIDQQFESQLARIVEELTRNANA
jgi:flagellar assembly protein FliH